MKIQELSEEKKKNLEKIRTQSQILKLKKKSETKKVFDDQGIRVEMTEERICEHGEGAAHIIQQEKQREKTGGK